MEYSEGPEARDNVDVKQADFQRAGFQKTGYRLADALGNDLGDKRLDILRRIGETGSISSAARAAGVSYKAAWQAIDTLANLAGTPLVDTAVGGSGGGGARLTEAGHRLIGVAERLAAARAAVLAELAELPSSAGNGNIRRDHDHDRDHDRDRDQDRTGSRGGRDSLSTTPAAVAVLGLRTSLRNQLPCEVVTVRSVGALVRVTMRLADGSTLASRITRESAELLELRARLPVLALCKATAVTMASPGTPAPSPGSERPGVDRPGVDRPGVDRPGVNRLAGRVSRVARASAGSAEVALNLASGLRLVGFAASGHGLKADADAVASFEETGVIIALATSG